MRPGRIAPAPSLAPQSRRQVLHHWGVLSLGATSFHLDERESDLGGRMPKLGLMRHPYEAMVSARADRSILRSERRQAGEN